MRTACTALALLAAGGAFAPALADPYRWCAQYSGRPDGTHCWFVTYEQCRATVSGVGGYCIQNPRNAVPIDEPVRRTRKRT